MKAQGYRSFCSICLLISYMPSLGSSLRRMKPLEIINPAIKVTHWLETGEMEWATPADNSYDPDLISFNASTSTMSISNNIAGVILSCTAKYPIEWVSDVGEQLLSTKKSFFLRGRSSREATDVYVEYSYTYTVDLNFRANFKEFTGNYTCRKTNTDSLSSSVYIFWEGVTPEYLVLSGKSVDVLLQPSDDKMIIPCRVSMDYVKVTLLKSVSDMYSMESFHRVELNETVVNFDPKIGFTVNLALWKEPYGIYKCVTEQNNDFVVTRVNRSLDGPRDVHHVNVIQRRARFSYDPVERIFTCCSNTKSQPIIYPVICSSPVTCKFYEKFLVNGIASMYQEEKSWMFHTQGGANKTCSTIHLHEGMMGYIQCIGDGIDAVRPFFTSIPMDRNDTLEAYTTWEEIDGSKLVTLSVNENVVQVGDGVGRRRGRKGSRRRGMSSRRHGRPFLYHPHHSGLIKTGHLPYKVYAGESFNFTCKASSSYFAHGSQITVSFSDGRRHVLPLIAELSTQSQEKLQFPVYSFAGITIATATVTLEGGMTGVFCHAPVHNSTKWVRQELKLNVNDPTTPSFSSGEEDELVYWTLNETDKWIECKAAGEPAPELNLTLNGIEIKNGKDEMVTENQNGTLTLRVKQVSHELHGDYLCTAYNVAGVVQKKFTVIVLEPTQWALIISLSVCLGLLVLALIGVGIKFQLQKKLRDRLLGRF